MTMEQRWDDLWQFSLEAIARTPNQDVSTLAFIAAGPVEDLIRYAAPAIEERVVDQIKTDPKFRRVLTGVWARRERPEFWQRITDLPLNAGNVVALLSLQPGVTRTGYVNGGRADQASV